MFLIADGTVKLSGRDHGIRKSTSMWDQPVEARNPVEIFKEVRTSLNQDETKDDAEARNDCWSIDGDFICRHHVEPRVAAPRAEEERFTQSTEIYRRDQDHTYTNPDVLQEGRIEDYWNMSQFKQREIDTESNGSNKIQKTMHACMHRRSS